MDGTKRGCLEQVADSAKVLQAILAAGANQRGEWDLPLSAEAVLPLPPQLATPTPPYTPGKHNLQSRHAVVPLPPPPVANQHQFPWPCSMGAVLPPTPAQRAQADAMRREVAARKGELDEALLSNAFAWMRKAADDRLDGMVALLQKVGQ